MISGVWSHFVNEKVLAPYWEKCEIVPFPLTVTLSKDMKQNGAYAALVKM